VQKYVRIFVRLHILLEAEVDFVIYSLALISTCFSLLGSKICVAGCHACSKVFQCYKAWKSMTNRNECYFEDINRALWTGCFYGSVSKLVNKWYYCWFFLTNFNNSKISSCRRFLPVQGDESGQLAVLFQFTLGRKKCHEVLTYLLTFLFTHATPRSASARLNVCVQHKQLNG